MAALSSNRLGFPVVLGLAWALMLVLTLMSFAGFSGAMAHLQTAGAAAPIAHSPPEALAPRR